jgi:sulfatase maturation enzyme AslB (radical SAM superfamily)
MKFNRNIKGNQVVKINGMYQSRYFHDATYVQTLLNQVSPSFCLAKWYNVSIHIPTGKTHSCYHPPTHNIPLAEIAIDVSALHNTKYKKEQRALMLKGERPSECNFCWQIEDSGNQLSDRAYRSKDVFEPELIEEAKTIENPNPRYVEVNFNQACNFKCSYCSPHLSTAWYQEIERQGSYQLTDYKHNDLSWINKTMNLDNSPDNPYVEAFWKWLPDVYPTLQTFRMTGGEPLMDKNTFKMFDYVYEHPKTDLHLSITSNCCPPGNQWNKFLISLKKITEKDAIDHFMLFCSLDSWGKQAAYIRHGMDFDMLHNNVIEYLKNSDKHSLTFIITFNALSYTGFLEYIKNILKMRIEYNSTRQLIWFDVPQLTSPHFLNPKILTNLIPQIEQALEFMLQHKETKFNQFKGFSDFEVSKVQRLIDWINCDTDFDLVKARKDFYLFFYEHDQRRGTNFVDTFPELENFWKECKDLNE